MQFVSKDDVSFLGTNPVPIEPFRSADFFELERERIFKKTWLFACREEELPEPGSFIVKDFEICQASVLITRGNDHQLRAFHNVCSHRLARLVWETHGQTPRFTCRYHGWGFNLAGELKNVPDVDRFFDLDTGACGLTAIHLGVSHGFVFINLDRDCTTSLADFLGGIADKIGEHDLGGRTSHTVLTTEVNANWKCMLDNFQETYHLSFTHALSVGDRSVGAENPFGHALKYEFYGPHRKMAIWGNPGHKPAPIEGLAARFGGVMSAGAMQQTDAHKSFRPENWQLDVHGIFPNVLIEIAPTFHWVHEFVPISVDRTRWYTRVYFPDATTCGQRFSQEYSIAAFRDTVAEDMTILAAQNASLHSGARDAFIYQTDEALCRHTLAAIQAHVGEHALEAAE
jgi:phenylpropionate dioxygenase-like ring-hydroxylating dioxygenase large terminal subunit